MAANVYEGMFILDSNRFGRDPEAVSDQIPVMIEKLGGEVLVSRLWEERKLAYPIKGQRKGDLADLLPARCRPAGRPAAAVPDHHDNLRVLFVKVEPRIVNALVAHARSRRSLPIPTKKRSPPRASPPRASLPRRSSSASTWMPSGGKIRIVGGFTV